MNINIKLNITHTKKIACGLGDPSDALHNPPLKGINLTAWGGGGGTGRGTHISDVNLNFTINLFHVLGRNPCPHWCRFLLNQFSSCLLCFYSLIPT